MKICSINLLIFLFSIVTALPVWCAPEDSQFFLEQIKVHNDFEFYSVVNDKEPDTTLNRSDVLSVRSFRRELTKALLESDFIHDNNRKLEKLLYLSVELEHFTLYKSRMNNRLVNNVGFKGSIEITNFGGQVVLSQKLDEIIEGTLESYRVYERGTPSWIFVLKEEFRTELIEFLSKEIIAFLDQIDPAQLEDNLEKEESEAIVLKTKVIPDSIDNTLTPWDINNNKSIIGIIGKRSVFSGLLLDQSGYFVCDMKAVIGIENLKVVDFNGDTLEAEIIVVDKRLELAVGLIGGGISYSPRPLANEKLEVGSEIYFRGYSGIPYLPIICGKGKTTGKIESWGYSSFLFNSNYSDNMSGSPIFNEDGSVIGVTVSSTFNNKYKEPVFLCYSVADIYAIFSIKQSNENANLE